MAQDMALRYRDPWLVPKILLGVIALIFAIVFLPTLLVAGTVLAAGRRFFTRWQWAVVLVGGLAAVGLHLGTSLTDYFNWLGSLVGLSDYVASITNATLITPKWMPPFTIIPYGIALAGAAGLILGDEGAITTMTPMRPEMGAGLVPKDRERIRNRLIKMPVPRYSIPVLNPDPELEKKYKGPKQDPKDRVIPMGRDQNKKMVWLSEKEMKTHGVILGSTGSGKTESIKWLSGALMDMGYSGVILDLKEDLEGGGLRDFCRAYTREHNIPYQEVALSDMDGYWYLNALKGLSADQATDSVISGAPMDDQFHASQVAKISGQMNSLIFHAHKLFPEKYPEPSIYGLGSALQKDAFKAAKPMLADIVSAIGRERAEELYSVLFTPDKGLKEEGMGFGLRLTGLFDTEAGRNVLMPGEAPDGNPRQALDFTAPGLTYIGASSTGYKELAKTVSSSVLSRINALAASVSAGVLDQKTMGNRFLIVDEANFIERSLVKNFLSRARSSDPVASSQPSLPRTGQTPVNGDDWPSISQNVNVAIMGKMNDPESAKAAAEYVGTQEVAKASRRITDGIVEESGSLQEDEEFLVKPEEFRKFREGEMILRTPNQAHWCQVPMRSWELDAYIADGFPRPTPNGFAE